MLYTIGSSNRNEADFFGELAKRNITFLADIRSSPYSRMPLFSQNNLMAACRKHRVRYGYFGQLLGGKNPILSTSPFFRQKLDGLYEMETQFGNLATMCAEGDPTECHRSYKVGISMHAYDGMAVTNILRNGTEEDIDVTIRRTKPEWVDQLALKAFCGA